MSNRHTLQDTRQLDQDGITTETKATGRIETDGMTCGDFEFCQDGLKLYQDEIMTETKARGGGRDRRQDLRRL